MFGISAFAETSFSTLGRIGSIVLASAQINADAIVTANGSLTNPFSASITVVTSITANGTIQGEGWTPVTPGTETWTDTTPSTDVWSAISPSTDTWTEVTAGSELWTEVTPSNDIWLRQG
jgi:hypothetical protein